jgi:hypothetical protein
MKTLNDSASFKKVASAVMKKSTIFADFCLTMLAFKNL